MPGSLSPADFASGAPAAGGRRRRHSRRGGDELVAGRRRRHSRRGGDEMVAGRRRRGGDVAPPPASVTQAAGELVDAGVPKTLEGGRKRATKAKKVAKALLKLSKKLGGRRRRGGSSLY